MGDNSLIQWTDHTFNPWIGCTKVSAGCKNCYAEAQDKRRFSMTMPGCSKANPIIHFGKGAPRYRTAENNWKKPIQWNNAWQKAQAETDYPQNRPRVFCASLADWLDDEVPIEWLADLLDLIRRTPNLDWLLLTKRPENWTNRIESAQDWDFDHGQRILCGRLSDWRKHGMPPANVWIGTTAENQEMADKRIPEILKIPAKVRFLSCEPLLEKVNLKAIILRDDPLYDPENLPLLNAFNGMSHHEHSCIVSPPLEGTEDGVQWVIAGGESGPGCRPAELEWFRSLRDQCKSAGVAFFQKQLGGVRDHRGELEDLPEDLRIREFPTSQPS